VREIAFASRRVAEGEEGEEGEEERCEARLAPSVQAKREMPFAFVEARER